jgi:hypothetical protein
MTGMLMSSLVIVFTCVGGKGRKRGQWGQSKGLKMGQWTLSMGQVRAEVCSYIQRATIPRKRVISLYEIFINTTHAILF